MVNMNSISSNIFLHSLQILRKCEQQMLMQLLGADELMYMHYHLCNNHYAVRNCGHEIVYYTYMLDHLIIQSNDSQNYQV